MSSFYESRNSIYCYKNSNVLVNKFNITNQNRLENVERRIVLNNLYELRTNKYIGKFDITHFTNIHKMLFEDIYPFAGLFRIENISKDNFRFAEWNYIESELIRILNELKNEEYLKNKDKEELSIRLAYYMSELNVLHPFREGNGRTIREFIRQLAFINGYILDFEKYEPKVILNAMIKSVVNTDDLEKIINECLKKI